ncbi:hypothetical protein MRB53_038686 [Persea americana]|nr:hypothetical protein MRB53_038686 [Persea americana]
MENYDLRSCFLPDLSGLHLRIFQFQQLLTMHMPVLAAHLESLEVKAAYLSQWFLSLFGVTCPLHMLFRIWDVIFAEGSSETIMRVALSLMKRNEAKILASREFEEIMQLLLSRALWETYACNADDFVADFMSYSGLVTRDSLARLDAEFREVRDGELTVRNAFLPDVTAAASRFLGRLWSPHAKSNSLSPPSITGTASRPTSVLRRVASKQSIASTMNSVGGSDGSNTLSTSTDATTASRESAGDYKVDGPSFPILASASKEDKDLHSQIEDLLTAMSEMQRDHAMLAAQLDREREERDEDHRVLKDLTDHVRASQSLVADSADLSSARLALRKTSNRMSASTFVTKQRLRDSLTRNKDELAAELQRSLDLSSRLDDQTRETSTLREQLRTAQTRLQDGQRERATLEKTVQDLRAQARASMVWSEDFEPDSPSSASPRPPIHRSETAGARTSSSSYMGHASTPSSASNSGLRELRLGRPGSTLNALSAPAPVPRRTTSMVTQQILSTTDHAPATEDDLLVELVAAKTAEAVTRQELEEVKGKLETLKRMVSGGGAPVTPGGPNFVHRGTASDVTGFVSGGGAGLTPPAQAAGGQGSGGWFGWGKRSVSPSHPATG